MKHASGSFIVLEGLDGAGTTTQSRMLCDALTAQGLACHLTREPTDSAVGILIRELLGGRRVADDGGEDPSVPEKVLCLLFAADRMQHRSSIERHRNAGTKVVCDRYVHSSIAYQSLDPDISAERVVEVNSGVSIPNVTFFLRVPVDVCLARLEQRNDAPTIYEKKDLLVAIENNYDASLALYEEHFGPVIEIDGTQPIDAVHTEMLNKLRNYLL